MFFVIILLLYIIFKIQFKEQAKEKLSIDEGNAILAPLDKVSTAFKNFQIDLMNKKKKLFLLFFS